MEDKKMTFYDKIKTMNKDEMRDFIYWVYMMGNYDGKADPSCCDSVLGYFGGGMLDEEYDSNYWEMYEG
jgi:hypothetical protein